jgi:hypothetical protein
MRPQTRKPTGPAAVAGNAKPARRASYAGTEPGLQENTPAGLRTEGPLRPRFDPVRDPLIAAQLKDMGKTEKERREETGRGSAMVRADRPHPELRPKDEDRPLRAAFDQAWLREQRAAQLAHFKQERAEWERGHGPEHAPAMPGRSR